MAKFLFLFLLTFGTTNLTFGQELIPLQLGKKRMFSTNYIEYRKSAVFQKFPGKMYFREKGTNDVYRKIGFYGSDIRPYILDNSESLKLFRRYRLKKGMEDLTSVGMFVAGITYFGFAVDNASQGYGPFDSFFGRRNVAISFITYWMMVIGNGYFGPSSENDLLSAVLTRNGFKIGDSSKRAKTLHLDLDLNSGVGLTLRF